MRIERTGPLHALWRRAPAAAGMLVLGLGLSTCKLDELVGPDPPGTLAVNPAAFTDSAAVGSRPVRTKVISVTNTGAGSLGWTATRARTSSWLSLSAASGSTPATLTLSLNPAGLFVGEYRDTVILQPADGATDPVRVPVRFVVQACRERAYTVGAVVTDSLTESDCEAPHRAGRFAKLYRFTGAAGDSVTVTLRSSAFSAYVLLDSATAGSAAAVAEGDRCAAVADAACLRYALLPRAGEYWIEVTSAPGGALTGAFTLEAVPPRPPSAPVSLAQFRGDSVTPVAVGALVGEPIIVARGGTDDPDPSDSVALQVEIQPLATTFGNTPSATGALVPRGTAATVRVGGLADNTNYRWQARAIDQTGRTSAWVAFGANADDAADVGVAISQRPNAPTGIGQFRSDGTTAIPAGATTGEPTVSFRGTVSDPDPGNQVRLEVEVQPFGTPFANIATAAGVLVANGTQASVAVTGLLDGVAYHWQVRTVDQATQASDWVPFAAPGQTNPDFRVVLPATGLAFATQPASATAGSAITPAVTVEARKVSGAVDTAFGGTVNVVIAPGTGTSGAVLGGTVSVAAVRGVATFSNLSVNIAGTGYRLLASATGLTSATSAPFDVTAAGANRLALTTAPSGSARSGIALTTQPVVQIRDAAGNAVAQAGVDVVATIASGPAGASVSGDTATTGASGSATFTGLTITGPVGNYTLRFSATGLTGVSSGTIGLTPGSADPTRTTATVPAGVAGSPTSILVTTRDGAGNLLTTGGATVTVTVTGSNSATPAVTDNGNGTYGASYTPTTAGTDAVAITLNGSPISGSPYSSTVTAAGGTRLVFVAPPSTTVAGAAISPPVQVAVRDVNGNTVTSSTAAITLAIGTNPGGGTLAGSLTVTAIAGVATFNNLSIDKVGTGYTLTASATGLTGATSAAFNVTPGAATRLAFTGQPSNTVAGSTILPPVLVTVQDANGNTVTSSTASITVGIGTNPAAGTLTGTLTVAAVNGVASFGNLSIDKAANGYTLTAASSGLASATSSAFNVQVGTGNQLAFIVQPPMSTVAGVSLSPAVQVAVQDQNGNTVTSSTAAITLALGVNPGGGTLAGTTTVNAVNGIATFGNLSINRTGSGYTLVATSAGLSGATSGTFTITPAPAAKLAFTVQPTNVVAGAAISPAVAVTVRDAFDNTVTASTATVTVAIGTNPAGGSLAGATSVTAVNGVATFSPLSIDRAGVGYTLTAAGTGLTGATSNGFNVTAGVAAKVGFIVQPSAVAAGAEMAPAVQVAVQDANGNTVTSSTAAVTLAIGANPGSGALSGTLTVTAVNGVASFADLRIDRTGSGYTLTATSAPLTGATSAPFTVTPGTAAALAFAVQPGNTVAGQSIVPAVQVAVRDALGNTVTTSTAAVTVAIGTNPAGGTLSGTLTRNAVNGVATFADLSVDAAGVGYTLTAASTGLTGATSGAFDIQVGSGNRLAFVVQPTSAVTGAAIAPAIQVAVKDAQGNTVPGATDAVTLVISANPGGATLGGTRTRNAVNGIATFSDVSLNRTGAGYTLNALGSGLLSATSAAFSITPASTSTAITADTPDPSVTGQTVPVAYAVTVTAPGSGTPTGNVTVSDGSGASCTASVAAGTCLLTLATSGPKTLTATYAGDVNFLGSTSPGVGHTVNQAATTSVIDSIRPLASVTGQPITVFYTVNVTSPGGGVPGGTVTVAAGADSCTGAPAERSCQLILTTAGAKSVTATYGGDPNYLASPTSAAVQHQVNPAATTTVVTADLPDPSVAGEPVTVSVAVAPTEPGAGVPTGSVTVSGGTGISCVATLASGAGSCAITFSTTGPKTISANYAGDANFAASSSAGAAHEVNAAPTITSITGDTPDPSAVGQPYTVTFTVAAGGGTPTGSVTVSDGSGASCLNSLTGGTGSCALTSVTAGGKTLTASYGGDANYAASVSTGVAHTVDPASTATGVTSSLNPSVFGQAVTFTATVTSAGGTPTGTVQFKADAVNLGAPVALTAGSATSPATTSLAVGTRVITAEYAGSTDFAASTGTLAGGQVVNAATTTATITGDTPDPSTVGQAVTVSYAVAVNAPGAGTPAGSVTVSDGAGTTCQATVAQGSCALTFTTVGTKTLTATYGGDAGFLGDASDPVDHQVTSAPTTTTVTSSVNPSVFGQAVSFTATVAGGGGTPAGAVQFVIDDVPFGDPVALTNGAATSGVTTSLGVGTHTVAASYTPADGNLTASSGMLSGGQVVNAAATTTTITSDAPDPSTAGVSVTVNYTVTANPPGSGTPTGNVTVSDGLGASCVGTVAAGTCNITLVTAGAITLTASYGGDASFGASSDTEPHEVGAAATVTTAASSQNPSVINQGVTFTATLTSAAGTPTGSVRFRVNGGDIAGGSPNRTLVNGVATSQIYTPTSPGTYVVTAAYTSNSANFANSLDTLDGGQVVNRTPTTTTLTSSQNPSVVGQSVTFTATVTGGTTTPTGAVQFRADGTALGGPVTLNGSGVATTATSNLAAGTRVITADYAGTTTLAPSADTLDQVVASAGAAATLQVTGMPDPVVAGTSAGLTVTARDGFGNVATGYTGTVSFASSDATAELPAPYAFVAGDAGTHTFAGVQLRTAGEQSITATDQANAALTGTQAAITVQPAGAATLTVAGISDPITAGAVSSATVTARDAFANVATGYVGTIGFTTTDAGTGVMVPANYTFLPGDNGAHTFAGGVTLVTTGERAVTATDQAAPAITGTQSAITVQAGPGSAAQTTAVVPATGTAGSPTAITITVRDANNNKVTGAAGQLAGGVTGANTTALAAATEQTGDTTYAMSYTPTLVGPDVVAITLGGVAISGSPFGTAVGPGAAASVTPVAGDGQIGLVGKAVNIAPAVLVEDALGNPIAGTTVTFSVTGGGGSATSTTPVTDAAGVARVGSWTLGPGAGANALQAAVTGADASFGATGQAAAYDVDVRYFGTPPSTTQQAAFTAAAARWEQLVFGDVTDVPVNFAADWCGTGVTGLPALAETIDDLVIYAEVTSIDGAGGILGQAGPCYIRTTDGLPLLGIMQFDAADLDALEAQGQLGIVILHEMGHVIGLGTLWNNPPFSLLANPCPASGTCSTDPHFTGARGLAAFDAVGGTAYVAGDKVPVEDTGGAGTRNGHWRDMVFANELMTGFLSGGSNPLSIVSVASFWDMGYLVNYADADTFAWSASPPAFLRGGINVGEDILRLPIGVVGPSGRVERVIQPSP